MDLIELRSEELTATRVDQVRSLLAAAFGGDFDDHDWQHALGGVHFLLLEGTEPIAHAALVERRLEIGERAIRTGYVEAVATAPPHQGLGHGTAVMRRVTELIRAGYRLGALSTSEHAFYERLGWERWQGPTYVRTAGGLVRTPDEDEGVMVLRVDGVLEAALPIVCRERAGDDW